MYKYTLKKIVHWINDCRSDDVVIRQSNERAVFASIFTLESTTFSLIPSCSDFFHIFPVKNYREIYCHKPPSVLISSDKDLIRLSN